MRQADVIDAIREIMVTASIDASPENYEICHRFVTRSDEAVCEAFGQALNGSRKIDARIFGTIKDRSAPAGRAAELDRQTGRLEDQLALVMAATRTALGHTTSYSQSLTDDAARLKSTDTADVDIQGVVANLLSQTKAMTERSRSLEESLAKAGSEMAAMRGELEKAKHEGGTDVLTGLPNRRAFDSQLLSAIGTAETDRGPLSLAFFDVDHFKAFNDTWGHQIGDHVLRFVGARLAAEFKEVGVAARYGGEEFILLLPGYGSIDALQAVKTFCGSISARVLRARSDGREIGSVTLSAGVATLRRDEAAETLVQRADGAMYAAKQAGRNRVLSA